MVKVVEIDLSKVPGQTPIDDDERAQLIPRHITTQDALDEWEQSNILRAVQWLARQRHPDVLSESFCRALHKQIFDRTWRWSGQFRRSDKNIGCDWRQIPPRLKQLLDNHAYLLAASAMPIDELAARFHHQLVLLHPFPNGNGRHARQMTDCVLRAQGHPAFSWGGGQPIGAPGEIRRRYITALQAADAGDVALLMAFVRS